MEFYVSRAMQIGGMTDSQISALHARENQRGYCLPNAAVQDMLHLPEIKTLFEIPDEPGPQAFHAQRIRLELLQQKIAQNGTIEWNERGTPMSVELKPWDAVAPGNVELTHAFDWRVYNAVSDGRLSLLYQGGPSEKKQRGGGLKSRVLSGKEAAVLE